MLSKKEGTKFLKKKLLILVILAISVVVINSAPSAFGEMTIEEQNARIREQVEKVKKLKEKQHPEIHYHLTDLEDAYKKDGPDAAIKLAKEKGLKIKDTKIRVHIILKPGVSAEGFDAASLEASGVDILSSLGDTIVADIPCNRFREVADNVEAIRFIEIPIDPQPDIVAI